MFNPVKNQHANPSGNCLLDHHVTPALEGQTVSAETLGQGPNIEAARAILAGKPAPAGHPWGRWQRSERAASYLQGLMAPPPTVTIADLAERFPDEPPADDPEDQPPVDRYNSLSPVERAIEETITTAIDADIFNPARNHPIFLHELRQAQRRTLEQLLAMATAVHHQEPETIEAARAYLAGENPPEENPHHQPGSVSEDVLQLVAAVPIPLTAKSLAEVLPDEEYEGLSPDEECAVQYNRLTPIERAIDQVLGRISGVRLEFQGNDEFYVNELRLFQRRLLAELLTLWDSQATEGKADTTNDTTNALEAFAAAKLESAMEASGFQLPAGRRWKVSVEAVAEHDALEQGVES